MSARTARLEARLKAVLAALEEARARVTALEDEADELQRRLEAGDVDMSDEVMTEMSDFGASESDGDESEGESSGSESDEPPPLPDRLDDPDGEEEDAPKQPDVTEEDRAEEARLSQELDVDMGKLCDDVVAHIKPVENKLCFESRKFVRTLAAAVLRSRLVRDKQFVYPPETENLVCGGATQARSPRARTSTQLTRSTGWQDHVRRRCGGRRLHDQPAVRGAFWCTVTTARARLQACSCRVRRAFCGRRPSAWRADTSSRLRSFAASRCRLLPPRCAGAAAFSQR